MIFAIGKEVCGIRTMEEQQKDYEKRQQRRRGKNNNAEEETTLCKRPFTLFFF